MWRIARLILIFCALALPGAALAQPGKPIVAVYQVDDIARTGQGQQLTAMIETAVAATTKFRVMERQQMNKLLSEQGKGRAGLVTTNTPGRTGGFEGVDFIIYGTITSVGATRKSDLGGAIVAGLLSGSTGRDTNCSTTYATLALDVKITDARTGEVRYVTRINETQRAAMVCGGGSSTIDTPLLMRSAADRVANSLVTTIFPIQVAAVQADGTVVLNYGEGTLAPGAVLSIFSKGQVIRDPATGEVLANDETQLGFVKVSTVTGRVSRALPISTFASPPPIGSIVRAATPAEIQALNKRAKRK